MNRFCEEDKRETFKAIFANFALNSELHKFPIKIMLCYTSNLLYLKNTPNFKENTNESLFRKVYHRRTNRQIGMISKDMLVN